MGTGIVLGNILERRVKPDDIIAFIDNDVKKKKYMGKDVMRPWEIVVVANTYSQEIYEQCRELGIDLKKVIFLYNNLNVSDYN